jgi:hypothetical protein
MTYLSGGLTPALWGVPNIGAMVSPNKGNRFDLTGLPYAADNGCFKAEAYVGDEALLRWLDTRRRDNCLFAVSTDVVGDATATWRRSAPMLPRIRDLGFKVAYVAQDGWNASVPDWSLFDVLFIGGTDAFKLGDAGRMAVADGRARGKAVHMGRCNSYHRLAYAAGLGCITADGTTIAKNPGRYSPEIRRWMARLNQPRLLDVAPANPLQP